MQGSTSGIELWASWQALPGWRLHGGYSRLWQELELMPGSNDVRAVAAAEGANPARRWLLRSSFELARGIEIDLTLRHASALSSPAVPDYTAADLRVGWRVSEALELSAGGNNLFGTAHGEFTGIATRSELRPSVFIKLTGRF
jgi:iron complex outermembrane receptor protein